ncbi:MAG: fluoride efflux transporter CrcB [Noviherbaspirillum sp.]
MNWLAVGAGAALGAWLRWGLSAWLNARFLHLPFGTLLANLLGGYLIGLAVGFFQQYPLLPGAWRLFIITGFLGGLTTFSSFSSESMMLLHRGEYGWALSHIGLHLLGSIALCVAGYASWRAMAG